MFFCRVHSQVSLKILKNFVICSKSSGQILRQTWQQTIFAISPSKNLSRIGVLAFSLVRPTSGVPLGAATLGFHRDGVRHVIFRTPKDKNFSPQQEICKETLLSRLLWFLKKMFATFKVILRTAYMCILLSPLVITAPIALQFETFQDFWLKLLVSTVQFCGPVYVKLGQWASTRRDIFPPKVCRHLSKLQRQAQTHPWEFTEQSLHEAFGKVKVSAILPEIDPYPIGSGCCAQIHAGWLEVTQLSAVSRKQLESRIKENVKSGRGFGTQIPVAIKVLHPDITERFHRDLNLLKSMVSFLSGLLPSLKWLSLKETIDEFSHLMEIQVDLTHEAENLLQFSKDFEDDSRIIFPVPILELCHPKIIVETFESGIPLSSVVNRLEQVPIEVRKTIANRGIDMLLRMIFQNNFVHGDLHPGNLMVRGLDRNLKVDDGIPLQLVILDPGISSSLSPQEMVNFMDVFTAVARKDGRRVGELFLIQCHHECTNPSDFVNDMESIVSDALSNQLLLSKLDVANLLSRVFSTLRYHRVKLDPNFTSVVLAIMVVEGLGRSLDPDIDLLLKAAPYLLKIKTNNFWDTRSLTSLFR